MFTCMIRAVQAWRAHAAGLQPQLPGVLLGARHDQGTSTLSTPAIVAAAMSSWVPGTCRTPASRVLSEDQAASRTSTRARHDLCRCCDVLFFPSAPGRTESGAASVCVVAEVARARRSPRRSANPTLFAPIVTRSAATGRWPRATCSSTTPRRRPRGRPRPASASTTAAARPTRARSPPPTPASTRSRCFVGPMPADTAEEERERERRADHGTGRRPAGSRARCRRGCHQAARRLPTTSSRVAPDRGQRQAPEDDREQAAEAEHHLWGPFAQQLGGMRRVVREDQAGRDGGRQATARAERRERVAADVQHQGQAGQRHEGRHPARRAAGGAATAPTSRARSGTVPCTRSSAPGRYRPARSPPRTSTASARGPRCRRTPARAAHAATGAGAPDSRHRPRQQHGDHAEQAARQPRSEPTRRRRSGRSRPARWPRTASPRRRPWRNQCARVGGSGGRCGGDIPSLGAGR